MNWTTTRNIVVLVSLLALGSPVAAGPQGPNPHASATALYLHAQAGDLLDVRIGDLLPTQAVLGYDEVFYKLGRYQAGKDAINKRFDDWCEASGLEKTATADANSRLDEASSFTCTVTMGNETPATIDPMKTAVIGHGGRIYLVDGHHTFTSFMETSDGGPNTHVRVRILGNLSQMGPEAFWQAMEENGWVWLRDDNDQPITVDQLPTSLGLGNFRNDEFRGLIYFTRDIAYKQNAQNANYQEFHWGTWLRNNPDFNLADYDLTDATEYLRAVKKAAELISGVQDSDIVDGTLTAGQLGRMNFDNSEFTKLSKSYCNSKPGKVAYFLYYYHNILGIPPAITCP